MSKHRLRGPKIDASKRHRANAQPVGLEKAPTGIVGLDDLSPTESQKAAIALENLRQGKHVIS